MFALLGDDAWAKRHADSRDLAFGAFLGALFDHYAVTLYAAIAAVAVVAFGLAGHPPILLLWAALLTAGFYSFVEYGLHRFILHARVLCRSPLTAPIWRRLHYDHHMEPADLTVLFADPKTSVPLLVVLAWAGAAMVDRPGMFAAMIATNFCAFLYYEFMHSLSHLPNAFGGAWMKRKKRNHMLHHHLDEASNYGIGSNLVDGLVGSAGETTTTRSPTVRDLGYDAATAARWPWVRDGYAKKRADGGVVVAGRA